MGKGVLKLYYTPDTVLNFYRQEAVENTVYLGRDKNSGDKEAIYVTDALGNITGFEYDKGGREICAYRADVSGNRNTYSCDGIGRQTKVFTAITTPESSATKNNAPKSVLLPGTILPPARKPLPTPTTQTEKKYTALPMGHTVNC